MFLRNLFSSDAPSIQTASRGSLVSFESRDDFLYVKCESNVTVEDDTEQFSPLPEETNGPEDLSLALIPASLSHENFIEKVGADFLNEQIKTLLNSTLTTDQKAKQIVELLLASKPLILNTLSENVKVALERSKRSLTEAFIINKIQEFESSCVFDSDSCNDKPALDQGALNILDLVHKPNAFFALLSPEQQVTITPSQPRPKVKSTHIDKIINYLHPNIFRSLPQRIELLERGFMAR